MKFKMTLFFLLCSLQTFAMDDADNSEKYGLGSCLKDACMIALYSTGHGALVGNRWDRVSGYTQSKLPRSLSMTKAKDQ